MRGVFADYQERGVILNESFDDSTWKTSNETINDESAGKQRVDSDSAFLMRMIELVRKGLGYEEDITSALLRLQDSCSHLSDCLEMKYLNA
jgi:hypothetical protein